MSYRRLSSPALLLVFCAAPALAQETVSRAAPAPSEPAAPPPPYALPWQLRGAGVATAVRADTMVSTFEPQPGMTSTAIVSLLAASYKLTSTLSPSIRVAVVGTAPKDGDAGTHLANPALGLTYAPRISRNVRIAFLGAVGLPLGGGGGDMPNPKVAAANKAAGLTRSGMDGAMFAVNDLAIAGGVDVAFVAAGLTVQAEATVAQCFRTRGEMVQPDKTKTNFTSGLHVGYFLFPELSVGGEVRYQRWLSTPAFVAANGDFRDTASASAGVRVHLKFGDTTLRPGIAFGHGLDDPMNGHGFHIVQLDVPVYF